MILNVTRGWFGGVLPSGLVHVLKVTAETEPAPEPDSPLPLLSLPVTVTDWQVQLLRVLVSVEPPSCRSP